MPKAGREHSSRPALCLYFNLVLLFCCLRSERVNVYVCVYDFHSLVPGLVAGPKKRKMDGEALPHPNNLGRISGQCRECDLGG